MKATYLVVREAEIQMQVYLTSKQSIFLRYLSNYLAVLGLCGDT